MIIIKVLKPVTAIVLMISLMACISDNDNPQAPITVLPEEGEKPAGFNDTWKTGCFPFESSDTWAVLTFEVSGNVETSFSLIFAEYSDNSCAQSKGAASSRSGTIGYGKKIVTSSGRNAYEIDLRFEDKEVWESLVEIQGNTLYLNPDLEKTGRPNDLKGAIEFSNVPSPTPSPIHPNIEGEWETKCSNRGIFTFDVSGDNFSLTSTKYSDSACKQSKEVSGPLPGTIAFGDELTTPSGKTAHEMDLQFEQGTVWKNLVARQGDTLMMSFGLDESGRPIARPDDFDKALEFSTK